MGFARLKGGAARGQGGLIDLKVDRARLRINGDNVAIFHQTDGAANSRFWTDMANAQATGCAAEPTIGNQRHLVAHALTINGSRG